MNDDLKHLEFHLIDKPFAEIFHNELTKQLKECTPSSWVTTPRDTERK